MKVKKWSKKSSGSSSSSGIASFKDEEQEITELIARKQKESPLPGQQRLRFSYDDSSIISIYFILHIARKLFYSKICPYRRGPLQVCFYQIQPYLWPTNNIWKSITGLTDAGLTICTDIQAAAIPHALAGRDILGAAKTGSGKTLVHITHHFILHSTPITYYIRSIYLSF